ncbi:MAG: hemolysin III family protein [Pseudomonadota bacterium]
MDLPTTREYSRGEVIADAAVHVLGVVAALAAVPVMITLAAVWHDRASVIVGASVYGASLIGMFAFSASYNLLPAHEGLLRVKRLLRRFDHGAIFIKIAGTYTPFAVLMGGADAVTVLIAIWTAAMVGLVLVMTVPRRFEWLSLALYLGMGWAALVVGAPMLASLSDAGLALVVIGGLLYTVGVAFHLWNRLPFQNAIWHAHVLAASFVFYAAVLVEVGIQAP